MKTFALIVSVLYVTFSTIRGECTEGCNLPITIYNDLKCRPIYASGNDCCPSEYDCSHIYNNTEETCHFKGKFYKIDEKIDDEDSKGTCDRECRCKSSKPNHGQAFFCPQLMDGCAEFWVSGYPGPRCYLRHEPNECCANGQICPPFDDNAKCDVNGKTYKEGEVFDNPTRRCNRCSCKKGFGGKYEEPFCEEIKCYAEIKNSGSIDHHCAPYYDSPKSCCPDKWICLTPNGKLLPPTTENADKGHLKCKFGTETVDIGGRYEDSLKDKKVHCECVVPPLLTCGPEPFKVETKS